MKQPSKERGCEGKTNLGSKEIRYRDYADRLATLHGKVYGVYKCPHCQGHHLTTKLENRRNYEPLVYITRTIL